MRVLVVEDEDVMADAVAAGLRRALMAVDVARDGHEGLAKALTTAYDVVVLDRDLPGLHGDRVCEELIRSGSAARILMLTASAAVEDRVDGLGLGADDYLVKPFAFSELVARISALGRRVGRIDTPTRQLGDVTMDIARRTAHRAGNDLQLTAKEFGVLAVLIEQPGRVVSAEELLERVWDEFADPFTNAVRVTMVGLRRKLGEPPMIATVRGSGYKIVVSDE